MVLPQVNIGNAGSILTSASTTVMISFESDAEKYYSHIHRIYRLELIASIIIMGGTLLCDFVAVLFCSFTEVNDSPRKCRHDDTENNCSYATLLLLETKES